MKTKHTPGPWNVVCIEGLTDWAFLGVGSEMSTKAVCHINFEAIMENGVVKIPDECKANAKLIAAAPELLEALEVCYASLCTYGRHPLIEKQVKSAIKKAT